MRRTASAWTTWLAAGLCLWQGEVRGQGGEPPLRPCHMVVMCSRSLLRSINRTDAVAAAKSWMDIVAKRRRFQWDGPIVISETLEESRRLIQEGNADLIMLDAVEYLKLAPLKMIEPVGSFGSAAGGARTTYLLLAGAETGATRLEDLKGKRLNLSGRSMADIGRMWLDVALSELRQGRVEQFFGLVKDGAKPSAACLPVFFGSSDACVIEQREFDVLAEMNPQMRTKLKVIARSPDVAEVVIGMRIGYKSYREEIIDALLELGNDPQGKQILLLFKTDRTVKTDPELFESLRGLMAKHQKLGPRGAEPGGAPTPARGEIR